MYISDVMTTSPVTAEPAMPVHQVVRLMLSAHVPAIPVVDASGRYRGLVRDEDLMLRNAHLHQPPTFPLFEGVFFLGSEKRFLDEARKVVASTAEELMADAHTVEPMMDLADVATLMVEKHCNAVPVVQDGRLLGLVTRADVIALLLPQEGPMTGDAPAAPSQPAT